MVGAMREQFIRSVDHQKLINKVSRPRLTDTRVDLNTKWSGVMREKYDDSDE